MDYRIYESGVPQDWITLIPALDALGDFSLWVEPPFHQGNAYILEIRVVKDLEEWTIFSETFDWWWTVREVVERFHSVYKPDFLTGAELASGLYTVHAKAMADLLAFYEDCFLQSVPAKATWAIGLWEAQLNLPTYPEEPLANRRALVVTRRYGASDAARTEFIQTISGPLGGSATLVDNYPDYSVAVRLPANPGGALRRALEEIIDQVKPAGINVVLAPEGVFLAGISEAGDPV
jgi:hypothetical protein